MEYGVSFLSKHNLLNNFQFGMVFARANTIKNDFHKIKYMVNKQLTKQLYLCVLCWGPAPAGSRGTLRMNGVGERDDTGLMMDWDLLVRGQK